MERAILALCLSASCTLALGAPPPKKSAAAGPDDGIRIVKLQPKAHPKFPGGRVVAMNGSAGVPGHHYLVENLTTLQPVTVTVASQNKGDDIRVAVFKQDWNAMKQDATTGAKGVAQVRFRTQGDARIQVSSKSGARPYRLLVAVGDDVKPPAKPAFMPADEFQKKHPK